MKTSSPTDPTEGTTTQAKTPATTQNLEVWALDDLVPYWRNPRKITDEAVNALARSIEEYGYRQPIVADSEGVIIIGHTRYSALRRLGYTHASVRIERDLSAQEIKQLRVIDNRSGEYSQWDFDKLMDELQNLDPEVLYGYFPEAVEDRVLTFEVADDEGDLPDSSGEAVDSVGYNDKLVDFMCPSCFHGWEMEVTPRMIQSGKIEVK